MSVPKTSLNKKLSTVWAWCYFYLWNIMRIKWEKVGNVLITKIYVNRRISQ